MLHIGGTRPTRLAGFIEPGIERGLDGRLLFLPCKVVNEFPQGAAGDNPHSQTFYNDPVVGSNDEVVISRGSKSSRVALRHRPGQPFMYPP
jgi:hypothetical protein